MVRSSRPVIVDPFRLIIFDIETGGLDRYRNPIIQVAMMATDWRSWQQEDSFEVKIKFLPENCDPDALKLTSYDPEVWAREGVTPGEAAKKMNAFFRKHASVIAISKKSGKPYSLARLCGWNSQGFDGPFLQHWFQKRVKAFMGAAFITYDAMQLAQWVFALDGGPTEEQLSFRLQVACERNGVPWDEEEAHDALYDCGKTLEFIRTLGWKATSDIRGAGTESNAPARDEPSVGRKVDETPIGGKVEDQKIPF